MFNSLLSNNIKILSALFLITAFVSCKKESALNFSDTTIYKNEEVTIEINIPKANGGFKAAKQINTTLANFTKIALNTNDQDITKQTIDETITGFIESYKGFKTEIGKTLFTELPKWEVLIDGELIYKNDVIVCIAMTSSINTGGVHSNLVFQFFNFDAKTGKELKTTDLINNIPEFTLLAKKWYNKEILSVDKEKVSFFEKTPFKLPKNIGFNEEGIVVFYDTYHSFSNTIIEFTIPYHSANPYLIF